MVPKRSTSAIRTKEQINNNLLADYCIFYKFITIELQEVLLHEMISNW